jgi:hypothetical protein
MNRTDIINYLIQRYNYNSYLEIGVQFPHSNFDKIEIENKTGVEPFPVEDMLNKSIVELTSDMFFKSLEDDVKYDIIFIDGLHTREQCLADILNSLNHLSPDGCILVHDCLPTAEYQTSATDNGREWTGDVWKAIVDIKNKSGIEVLTIDTDWGIGFIRNNKEGQPIEWTGDLDWDAYTFYKHELLNIKTIEEWNQIIKGAGE